MKKLWIFGLLLCVSLLAPAEVRAEIATPQEMETVCTNWLAYKVHETGSWAGDLTPRIKGVHELIDQGMVLAHVFSISPQGYVAVPILKELPPMGRLALISSLIMSNHVSAVWSSRFSRSIQFL